METKPRISYGGEVPVYESISASLIQQLPAEACEWRRSFGRAPKNVYVEAVFVPLTDDILPRENDWKLIGQTFFHTYWTDCSDVDQYKANVKDEINTWMTTLKNHNVHDWIIVTVEATDGKKGNKAKLLPRASVLDKIRNDFCSRQPDRCIALLDPQKSDTRGAESWQSLLQRLRQLLLQAYNRQLGRFEEYMRSQRERRNEPGWTFCEYFLLQEELAFVFEMLGIYDDALVQYDELDALFTQFVLNSNVGDTPEWLNAFSRHCEFWAGVSLSRAGWQKKRDLINSSQVSLLDLRNYLFSRQCALLLLLCSPWEVAQRTLPFLHNCINELKILEVELPAGAVSCWVFLSCLEVLHTCERFNDSNQVEAYSLYTASLWAYARDKLRELGEMCGLMPGVAETSQHLQLVVGLLTGMGDEPENTNGQASPMAKLREALSSKDAFQKHYLELSELAMGTFKHIGRIRSARLIGRDLAHFYMKLGEPQKAAAFLSDALKTYREENWMELIAQTLLELARCYSAMQDQAKYIKCCIQISSSPYLSDNIRLSHFQEMLSFAERTHALDSEVLLLSLDCAFLMDTIGILREEVIIPGSSIEIVINLCSLLPEEIHCDHLAVSIVKDPESAKSEVTPQGSPRLANRAQSMLTKLNKPELVKLLLARSVSTVAPSHRVSDAEWLHHAPVSLQLQEHYEHKQDKSLNMASLVCANSQVVLRRRDSQILAVQHDRPVIKDDFSLNAYVKDVTLVPGINTITIKTQVKEKGSFSLHQLSAQCGHIEFLLSRVSPPVSFTVIAEPTRIYLLRNNKEDLLAGVEQPLVITVHTGSQTLTDDAAVHLQASKGLLLKVEDTDDAPTFKSSVDIRLPAALPFSKVSVEVKVLSDLSGYKEKTSLERKIIVSCPWATEKQEVPLSFVPPFTTSHKLHTSDSSKFVQVSMQGLHAEEFELTKHQLTVDCEEVSLVPLNPPSQKLIVSKNQSASFMWELASNVKDSNSSLRLEFSVYFCWKPRSTPRNGMTEISLETKNSINAGVKLSSKEATVPQKYAMSFSLGDYATLYTVRSRVEPKGSEFCRVGNMCHMHIQISNVHPSQFTQLMYEVLADQTSWAVCGRTAGVVTVEASGKHSVMLDVMPLTRGFLPLPAVRLSKYIPADQKPNNPKDSPRKAEYTVSANYPRLQPFSQGQVYNWSKALQVHVLPAPPTISAAETQSN